MRESIIALDDLNFFWTLTEARKVKQGYRKKLHISEIAKNVNRPQDEVALLIMDLGRRGLL